MNPAKRKKLLRFSVESSNLEMGLKLIEDSKKDKKKKTTTQES